MPADTLSAQPTVRPTVDGLLGERWWDYGGGQPEMRRRVDGLLLYRISTTRDASVWVADVRVTLHSPHSFVRLLAQWTDARIDVTSCTVLPAGVHPHFILDNVRMGHSRLDDTIAAFKQWCDDNIPLVAHDRR